MEAEYFASSKINETLSLKIMPAEQCNIRCATCYEDLSIGRMPKKVVQEIKNLINFHLPEIKFLSVEWFGGEPLIATDVIYDISDHILKEIRGKKIHYLSRITTDGFLLNRNTFKKLLSKEVRSYQIILGKFQEKHDETIHRINGCGSYGHIWYNLLSMKEVDEDFNIMITINIKPENDSSTKELYELVRQVFSNDQRFEIIQSKGDRC